MTPVETLTAAIEKALREREGVTEGPWTFEWIGQDATVLDPTCDEVVASMYVVSANGIAGYPYEECGHNERHIASWSPSVTDPVVQAWRALLDEIECWQGHDGPLASLHAELWGPVERAVLASATAYLAGAA